MILSGSNDFGGPHRFRRTFADDSSIDEAFKSSVNLLIRTWPNAEDFQLTEHVEAEFTIHYAPRLQELATDRTERGRLAQECLEEAKESENDIRIGVVTKYIPGKQSWSLPACGWNKLALSLFLFFALVDAPLEWLNFGWFLRYYTQSFSMGLALSFAVMTIPVAEEAFFTIIGLSGRGRKFIACVQALIGASAACGYVYFAFQQAGFSLQAALSPQGAPVSPDSLRMACQLVISLAFCALCISAVHSLGWTKPTKNPAYVETKNHIKSKRREAGEHFRCIARINGAIEQLRARKDQATHFCQRQLAKIANERQRHAEKMNQILEEEL